MCGPQGVRHRERIREVQKFAYSWIHAAPGRTASEKNVQVPASQLPRKIYSCPLLRAQTIFKIIALNLEDESENEKWMVVMSDGPLSLRNQFARNGRHCV